MNNYLMEIGGYFGVSKQFYIAANNKQEATEKAKVFAEKNYRDNYKLDSIKCIKKCKK